MNAMFGCATAVAVEEFIFRYLELKIVLRLIVFYLNWRNKWLVLQSVFWQSEICISDGCKQKKAQGWICARRAAMSCSR